MFLRQNTVGILETLLTAKISPGRRHLVEKAKEDENGQQTGQRDCVNSEKTAYVAKG